MTHRVIFKVADKFFLTNSEAIEYDTTENKILVKKCFIPIEDNTLMDYSLEELVRRYCVSVNSDYANRIDSMLKSTMEYKFPDGTVKDTDGRTYDIKPILSEIRERIEKSIYDWVMTDEEMKFIDDYYAIDSKFKITEACQMTE